MNAALLVILAGVCAALHIGKLPPAVGALREALGISLVDAGFLLSMVQFAGMSTGLAMGAWVDRFGMRRSMIAGLALLGIASIAGGLVRTPAALLLLRAAEGFGFLMVVLPAPALVRALVKPGHVNQMMGVWGTYMPLGTAIALLAGGTWIEYWTWRSWWWSLGALTAAMALTIALYVPQPSQEQVRARSGLDGRIRLTLSRPGPWLLALIFASYSSQWLAVIGFLPTIYEQAGVEAATRGGLTALAAGVNIVGNIVAGRLLQQGLRPVNLLRVGFTAMALSALIAFAGRYDTTESALVRYLAVLSFSLLGGLVPATLFSLAVRLAPGEGTISTTVGWMQQWSALGQFAGPPVVAWVASRVGGWHWTGAATGFASVIGLILSQRLKRLLP
ncbi:MAG TPA: MFS transporter [Burkholderiaceae bacterium]|nr:MFS transporter [Burkholderiaceae bacterium]